MSPRSKKEWIQPLALQPDGPVPAGSLPSLRRQARECHACPLWQHATQVVFGAGTASVDMMLIGEQPGDQEDEQGKPFVGPAGGMLDRALAEAGLERSELYLTNAVKHFKFEPRGKRRLHQRANAQEQAICRRWLVAELREVRPTRILALGAMAAKAVFGSSFRLTMQRGQWAALREGVSGMATWHPSAILRSPDAQGRARRYAEFVADLKRFAAGVTHGD
ncbi:DNA polymerase [Dyella jiangningensis]|uniref:UdgX family uracil-DNA binding protein n=1 Tax=Dyella sp. AtDHG13 TaxID=1938897 RepID=UPI00088BA570|nr:UdgX family uracil-DNA binding protein [Dyella sp. AtDHG13]PXV55816.1 DNA polymerase [Dyella sp. AtDHG13]SDK55599.1 DNA polymerase [Dyella jiangningensis]